MDFNRNDSPNNNNNNNDGRKPGGNRPKGSIGTALLITLAIVLLVNWFTAVSPRANIHRLPFRTFSRRRTRGSCLRWKFSPTALST